MEAGSASTAEDQGARFEFSFRTSTLNSELSFDDQGVSLQNFVTRWQLPWSAIASRIWAEHRIGAGSN